MTAYSSTKKAESEAVQKMLRISHELKLKDLLQPHRTFVRECMVQKHRRGKSCVPCKLYLFTDLFIYSRNGLIAKTIRQYPKNELVVQGESEHLLLVKLKTNETEVFEFSTSGERDEWLVDMRQV